MDIRAGLVQRSTNGLALLGGVARIELCGSAFQSSVTNCSVDLFCALCGGTKCVSERSQTGLSAQRSGDCHSLELLFLLLDQHCNRTGQW